VYRPGAPPPRDEISRHHEDEVEERRRTGKRFHDGFYLRLGLGAGYLISSWKPAGASESSGDAQGFTIPFEFALGGSPTPGLVLGVGWWDTHLPAVTYSAKRGESSLEETADYGAVGTFGPFIDVYPAPRAGFHLQAAPCVSRVAPGKSDEIATDTLSGVGYGAMLGLGYESWVADQWGIGILLRGTFTTGTITDESGREYDFWGLMPGLLFTATFH
jgi:hypothetical protein